jgi:chromosome partitioning protein
MGKVISFANFQNSSGKTTFIIETAKTLQMSGKTTILVDFDPKGDLTRELNTGREFSILDILQKKADFHEVIRKTEIENTFILPSNLNLVKAKYSDLKNLDEVMNYLNGKFDYILIDTPPYKSAVLSKSLEISDRIVSPVVFDELSLYKIGKFVEFAGEDKLKVIPNRYTDQHIPFLSELFEKDKKLLFEKDLNFIKIGEHFRGDWLTLIDF